MRSDVSGSMSSPGFTPVSLLEKSNEHFLLFSKSGTGVNPGVDMDPDAAVHRPTLKFDAEARFAIRLTAEAA